VQRVILSVTANDADDPAGLINDRELVDLETVHGRERVFEGRLLSGFGVVGSRVRRAQ
jgi:hypothetical protein